MTPDNPVEVLRALLDYAAINECEHDETHRGGSIWTICDGCDQKWADDEGGFQPYREPEPIARAKAFLATATSVKAADIEAQAETYRMMHEDALALGYPSILEALEATPPATSVKAGEVEACSCYLPGDKADCSFHFPPAKPAPVAGDRRDALTRMVAIDEEIEAANPGYMDEAVSPSPNHLRQPGWDEAIEAAAGMAEDHTKGLSIDVVGMNIARKIRTLLKGTGR